MFRSAFFLACCALGMSVPAHARDNLGLYEGWGAFRDPAVPRCYAIAMAEPSSQQRDYQPYATVGTWPKRSAYAQIHIRVSRVLARDAPILLKVAGRSFELTGGGGDAWPRDGRDNAAILAAMRSGGTMSISARDAKGHRFGNTWRLAGAASAMDAAALGCAR